MEPCSFPESNDVLGPPAGSEEAIAGGEGGGVASLSVFRGHYTDGDPCTISYWKPTKEEVEAFQRGEGLWMMCMAHTMPPTILKTGNPFTGAEVT
jgi:hypothetical protein